MIDLYIRKIEERYDPEHDIPADPEVTWVDAHLLWIIEHLQRDIDELTRRLEALEVAHDE